MLKYMLKFDGYIETIEIIDEEEITVLVPKEGEENDEE